MKEFVEKLIGRLEEETIQNKEVVKLLNEQGFKFISIKQVIKIVNQLAEEYINSSTNDWILCEFELPIYTGEYNVTVVVANELGSYEDVTTLRFENIKGKEPRWVIPKDKIYRVIAWKELPKKYQKGE